MKIDKSAKIDSDEVMEFVKKYIGKYIEKKSGYKVESIETETDGGLLVTFVSDVIDEISDE